MGPIVRPEQSWGLGTMHGPATPTSLARQCGELGLHFLPHQHHPRGPHVEAGLLHQAKAVMSRGKKEGWAGKEGKEEMREEADMQRAEE